MTDLLAEIKIDLVGVDRQIGREQMARQPSRPAAAAQGAAMGVALNALMAGLSRGRSQTPRRNIQTGRMRTPQPWTGRADDSVRFGDTTSAAARVRRRDRQVSIPTARRGRLRTPEDRESIAAQRPEQPRVRRRPLVGERPIEGDVRAERQLRQPDYDNMMRDVEAGVEPRKAILREIQRRGSGSTSGSRLLEGMSFRQIEESVQLPESSVRVESTIKDYLKQNLEGFRESSQ